MSTQRIFKNAIFICMESVFHSFLIDSGKAFSFQELKVHGTYRMAHTIRLIQLYPKKALTHELTYEEQVMIDKDQAKNKSR